MDPDFQEFFGYLLGPKTIIDIACLRNQEKQDRNFVTEIQICCFFLFLSFFQCTLVTNCPPDSELREAPSKRKTEG